MGNKRKTTRRRGNEFQRQVRDFFLERGWWVHNQTAAASFFRKKDGSVVYTKRANDLFGCVDIISKSEKYTCWIQATVSSNLGEKIKKLSVGKWNERDIVLVFMKRPSGEWNIIRYYPNQIEDATRLIAIVRRKRLFYTEEAADSENLFDGDING